MPKKRPIKKVVKKKPIEKTHEPRSDFDKVADVLDKFGIPDVDPLPEEFEHYLRIPFDTIHDLTPEELHMHMAATTHQLGYLDNLVANAQIEVMQLERQFAETYHEHYHGQNKKLSAEKGQLDSGVWEALDVARGILARVQTERNRLENLYKYFSRVLSSRQGGL